MRQPTLIPIVQPGLTLTPGVATVVELIKTRYGNRQGRECLANLMLQPGSLLAGQPRLLRLALGDLVQHLVQNLGGNHAHVVTPLLPAGVQVVMKTLGFRPLGAVKTHDFIVWQNKLQLTPYQPTLAVDGQKLIKRNKVFVAFSGDFHPGVEQNNAVIGVLRQAFA